MPLRSILSRAASPSADGFTKPSAGVHRGCQRMKRVRSERANGLEENGQGFITAGSLAEPAVAVSPWPQFKLLEALQALKIEHRQLIEMAYLEGMSSKEMATWLGIPIEAVQQHLQEAFFALTEQVAPGRKHSKIAQPDETREKVTRA